MDEDEMSVVRRIFEVIGVEGRAIRAVRRELASEGLPTPGGLRHWSQMTIRLDGVYKPHTHEEIRALVSPEVAECLDPEERYAHTPSETFDSGTPEDRHRLYGACGLEAIIHPNGTVEISTTVLPERPEEELLCSTQALYSTP